jgi:hypothetical protein
MYGDQLQVSKFQIKRGRTDKRRATMKRGMKLSSLHPRDFWGQSNARIDIEKYGSID